MTLPTGSMIELALTALLLTSASHASVDVPSLCSCLPPEEPLHEAVAAAADRADVVVTGLVIGVEHPDEGTPFATVRATLVVEERWRGEAGDTIRVVTPAHESMCGFPFREGERYLAYAKRTAPDRDFSTQLCDRTARLDRVDSRELEVLRKLRSGDQAAPERIAPNACG